MVYPKTGSREGERTTCGGEDSPTAPWEPANFIARKSNEPFPGKSRLLARCVLCSYLRRIWRCPRKSALFSDLGSLDALVEWHIRNSPAGLTCRELSEITKVRVDCQIRHISKQRGLIRQKFDGEYVYFYKANEKLLQKQRAQRRKISSMAGPDLETTIEKDIASLRRDFQMALVLLNHPKESAASIVSRLGKMGYPITKEDLWDFFLRYDVKKNR